MTDETNTNNEALSEEQKEREAEIRRTTEIQIDVQAKRAKEDQFKRIASMGRQEFEAFTRTNWGF
jgi:hypothetical protein